jgi:hypothetical protein
MSLENYIYVHGRKYCLYTLIANTQVGAASVVVRAVLTFPN